MRKLKNVNAEDEEFFLVRKIAKGRLFVIKIDRHTV